MDITDVLKESVQKGVSDVFIVAGAPISLKEGGVIKKYTDTILKPEDTEAMIKDTYELAERNIGAFKIKSDDDFSFSIQGVGRFRVNAYKQRNSMAAVIRIVYFELPNAKVLGIPDVVINLAGRKKGLVLVTGPAGSGKSTSLACIINAINERHNGHIITLEDPIEYMHRHKASIVSQREVGIDTASYVTGLKGSLREAPDVILVGEMRDYETIQIAMTAAETGQLLFSTLHTLGAANTIDRIIDVFPPKQQQQIRIQLSMVLQAIVSQQLLPGIDGRLVPVFEIMLVNSGIRNMIRDAKTHQLEGMMANSVDVGMQTMDTSILKAYEEGKITKEVALMYANQYETLLKKIEKIR